MLFYLIYWLISPLIWLIILLASTINSKIGHHWKNETRILQSVKEKIQNNNKKVILLHSSSMGEFEQIKPIIENIDKKKYFILLSFFSPTGYKEKKNITIVDAICYHPFDFIWSAFFFFKKINIQYYIITRNDIWPNHLFVAKKLKICTALINANFYKKSHINSFLIKYIYKQIFKNIDVIATGSERLKNNLKHICETKKIYITGDSRIDQVINRKKNNDEHLLPNIYIKSHTIIFGSIENTDNKIIFSSLKEFYPNGNKDLKIKNHCIIIVPHEITSKNLTSIYFELKKMNFNPIYYDNKNELNDSRVVIINTVGLLADLYKYSDLAYVGAGFNGGIHSIIEPMIYSNIISFGPKYDIVDMAIKLIELKLVKVIKSKKDFLSFLNLLNNKKKFNHIKSEMEKFSEKQTLSSNKIINRLFLNE